MEEELLQRLDEFIKEKYIRPESTIKLRAVPSNAGKVADQKGERLKEKQEEKTSALKEESKVHYSISVRDEPVKEHWFKRLKNRIESIFETEDTFTQRLWKLIDQKGLSDVEVYKRANLDRKLFSKIRNQKSYKPSRGTAIALVIALELSMEETRVVLCQDLKQIKMRIFHRKINICSLSCIYAII